MLVSTGMVTVIGFVKFLTGIGVLDLSLDTVNPTSGDLGVKPGASGANPCDCVCTSISGSSSPNTSFVKESGSSMAATAPCKVVGNMDGIG